MSLAVDDKGKLFKSLKEMCREHGINYDTYRRRRNKGASKSEALAPSIESSKDARTDHLGREFSTIKEMTAAHGVTYKKYAKDIKAGKSKEEALTKRDKPELELVDLDEARTDHKGRVFNSRVEMCSYYGIRPETYVKRLKYGYSKKDALTDRVIAEPLKYRTDKNGTVYVSMAVMCGYLGLQFLAYKGYITDGFTSSQAIDMCIENGYVKEARKTADIKERTDHLGNVYRSKSEMCAEYGKNLSEYAGRIRSGWTKEQALMVKVGGVN